MNECQLVADVLARGGPDEPVFSFWDEVWFWLTGDELRTIAIMLIVVMVWIVWRHERAHCASIGRLQAENRAMRRVLNISDKDITGLTEGDIS